ncbi:MAG: hypothetical protein ACOVRN_01765 [Flavobacterium sp.]
MDNLDDKIQSILRQTDYTDEIARQKLELFHGDELQVIRDYLGIAENKSERKVASVNQAIYQQLRGHMDGAMKGYRERVANGEARKID